MCSKPKLESLELIELEAACFFATRWIPHFPSTDQVHRHLERLITRALASVSHFVRTAAVDVVAATCNREEFENCAKVLVDELLPATESRTALDVLSSISNTALSKKLLQGHPSIDLIWRSLRETDQIVAESARCCLRAFIRNASGSLLLATELNTPVQLVAELDALFFGLLARGEKRSISAAIALLRFQPPQLANPHEQAYSQWCIQRLLDLLETPASPQTVNGDEPMPADLHSVLEKNREFVIEQVASSLLSSHQNGTLPQSLLQPVLQKLVNEGIENLKTAHQSTQWQLCIKIAHLLSPYWSSLSPPYDSLVTFVNTALHNVNAPISLKIVVFDILNSIVTVTLKGECMDWTLFDRFMPELLPLRFIHAWEVRDSLIQLFRLVLLNSLDVQGCVDRHLIPAICAGLGDESEHVRATALSTIGKAVGSKFFFEAILDHSPGLLDLCFTTVDSQDSSRIAQCKVISQMLSLDFVVEALEQRPTLKTNFSTVLDIMFSDEDYEVRHAVVDILATISHHYSRLSHWWQLVNGSMLLKKAVLDESRLVRLTAWNLVRYLVSNSVLPPYNSEFQGHSLEVVDRFILEQQVEESYDPDDEVYPLAPGIADNDLDCPF